MIGADADVDRLAEDLRVDGVVVDRFMGSGEAEEAHDRMAQLVREVSFPVYVALVDEPAGLPSNSVDSAEALAGLLSRRLGSGLYVIQTTEGAQRVLSFGLHADPARLSLSAYANGDLLDATVESLAREPVTTPAAVRAEAQVLTAEGLVAQGRGPSLADADYPATLTAADADRLAERAVRLQAAADWRKAGDEYISVRVASKGLAALLGGLVALIVALLVGQSVRGWPRYRKASDEGPRETPVPDLESERRHARKLVDDLSRELEATDWATDRDAEIAGRALTARDAAEPLLESDDVADLVGAQVIARAGSRDLERGARGTGRPLTTCFFDPRHSESEDTVAWRLGDGDVEVPCCAICAERVAEGQTPDHLRLPGRRSPTAYWDREDVWARTGFGATTDFLARDVLSDRAGER
ncbi:hypothetical protein [Nocardioides sp. LHG3406-4]|uniref:hypothetical protein n=1 Tax=Nocardioides sp. LHG3406-4 TaxID=2804575 RepID=UPI003CF1D317